jgi:hypothetical protein
MDDSLVAKNLVGTAHCLAESKRVLSLCHRIHSDLRDRVVRTREVLAASRRLLDGEPALPPRLTGRAPLHGGRHETHAKRWESWARVSPIVGRVAGGGEVLTGVKAGA